MGMNTARFNLEMRNAQKNEQVELRDFLARIVKDVDDIRRLVALESPNNPIVEEVMASLQTVSPLLRLTEVPSISHSPGVSWPPTYEQLTKKHSREVYECYVRRPESHPRSLIVSHSDSTSDYDIKSIQ